MSIPSDEPPMPPLRPNSSAPKTIGILNIVFGVLLLLCGVCSGAYTAMIAAMGPAMAVQQEQMQAGFQAVRQGELKKLQDKEEAAEDEKEKAEIQAKRKKLEAQPLPKMPDTTKFMTAPAIRGYYVTDVLSGIVLNVLLIVSGVGLLGFKAWARVLAVWLAGIKIVRLVLVYGYFIFVAAPIMAQEWRNMMEEIVKTTPTPPPPGEMEKMVTVMGVAMTSVGIGMIVLGAIYPLIVLVVLTRPRVKAACVAPLDEYDEVPEAGSEGPAAE